MDGSAAIKRYAEAFLEYAEETIGFEKGLEELKKAKDVFRDNPQIEKFLEGPQITYSEKCSFIDAVFREGFSREVLDFLKLLLKNGRIERFTNIAEYARMKYAHGEEVEAVLDVSYPLDTDIMQSMKDGLEKRLNKKLHMYVNIDPSLLGGVRVTVGNTIIDGSVRKRLEDLKMKLMALKVE